jgi:predicted acylesterase/phospholipase RssA
MRYGPDETPVREDLAEQREIVCDKGEVIRAVAARDRKDRSDLAPGIAEMAGSWDYAYWTVDGGVMNNEPMEFARKAIAGPSGRNERSAVQPIAPSS